MDSSRTPEERAKRRVAVERGAWRTRYYTVTLSDGSFKQCYAASKEEANARVARHLARIGDPRTVA